jgi:hypothetical protein
MSDPTPASSTEKTIVVTNNQLCRLWTFTYISIGLNVLILCLFVICAIVHHHGHHKHHHRHGGDGGRREQGDFGRGGQGFHHHGGGWGGQQGWGNRGGGGGDRQGGGFRGNGFGGQGPGMMGGNPGMGPGGFGMRGMRGGENNTPPDPAKMTDMLLNQLSAKLTLTDDEKAKIKPIILEQTTQMQKDMEAQRLARQKAMEDTKAKIKALLTPDQQKQLDAIPLPGQKPADAAPAPAAAK